MLNWKHSPQLSGAKNNWIGYAYSNLRSIKCLISVTRISITEIYKEFYTNDICSTEPKLCDWIEETFIQNEALVGGKINLLAQNDPYWHQVNLFYLQMEGLKNGIKLRADEDPRYGSTGGEGREGI